MDTYSTTSSTYGSTAGIEQYGPRDTDAVFRANAINKLKLTPVLRAGATAGAVSQGPRTRPRSPSTAPGWLRSPDGGSLPVSPRRSAARPFSTSPILPPIVALSGFSALSPKAVSGAAGAVQAAVNPSAGSTPHAHAAAATAE